MPISIADLALQQRALVAQVDALDDAEYRVQFNRDLSPAGWHLGHTVFVENFWLRERMLQTPLPRRMHRDFLPENTPKSARGARLSPKDEFVAECAAEQRRNIALLGDPPRKLSTHRLLRNAYLVQFLAQHHAMHNETLCMMLAERQARRPAVRAYRVRKALHPESARLRDPVRMRAASHVFGTDRTCGFDNERPRHRRRLEAFCISRVAVSNAEYLGFMLAGGYTSPRYWSRKGVRWLRSFMRRTTTPAPCHWRRDRAGRWFGVAVDGAHDLQADAPVYGVNRFEAGAFARYAGARLPSEFEWEAAAARLEHGRVWEWCADTFRAYPNFRPFPYERYSQAWFDGEHYTLRGCSAYSPRVLRRRTLRNFYSADKRHIFAGLRLAL